MTADRLAQGLREPEPAPTDRQPGFLPASAILATCDRLLDEVGRRRHMFAWLRAPGSSVGEWLAVDLVDTGCRFGMKRRERSA